MCRALLYFSAITVIRGAQILRAHNIAVAASSVTLTTHQKGQNHARRYRRKSSAVSPGYRVDVILTLVISGPCFTESNNDNTKFVVQVKPYNLQVVTTSLLTLADIMWYNIGANNPAQSRVICYIPMYFINALATRLNSQMLKAKPPTQTITNSSSTMVNPRVILRISTFQGNINPINGNFKDIGNIPRCIAIIQHIHDLPIQSVHVNLSVEDILSPIAQ